MEKVYDNKMITMVNVQHTFESRITTLFTIVCLYVFFYFRIYWSDRVPPQPPENELLN